MNQTTAADEKAVAALLESLSAAGTVSPEVAAAFEDMPRRAFVPSLWQDDCWSTGMLPIPCGEAIEGADLQATVISALQLEPGHRVLEIGTGTGFTAAIISRLVARVTSVERFGMLVAEARRRFEALAITNVTVKHADGSNGAPADGPYDRIIAWAAFDSLPRAFVDQVATSGLLIAPIGPAEGEQELVKLVKTGSRFDEEAIARVRLQPMTRGVALAL